MGHARFYLYRVCILGGLLWPFHVLFFVTMALRRTLPANFCFFLLLSFGCGLDCAISPVSTVAVFLRSLWWLPLGLTVGA